MFGKEKRRNEMDAGSESSLDTPQPRKKGKFRRFLKRRRKLLIVCLILVIVAAVALPKMLGPKEVPALAVATEAIQRQTVEEVVSIKGTVEGSETAELTSALNKKIVSINVKEGDRVAKGTILAVLDGSDLQDDLSKAESQYQQQAYALQDELKNKQKDYDAAVLAMNESQRVYENNKSLYEAGAISKEDFLKSENAYKNDQATVNSFNVSNGQVIATGSQNKNLDIQREEISTKSKDLQDIYITSPISGTVTRVNAKLGRYAADTENKEAMFVVENLDQLQMNVKISEYDISRIQVGQKVSITSDVLGGQKAEGIVSQIAPSGEQKESTSKEMIVPVKISITNDGGKLMAGVTGNAEILIHQSENAVAVPVDALLEDPETGGNFVFVVGKDSKLKKIPVTIGVESDFYAEVTDDGLKEGDQVVMSPDFNMTEGMEVTAAPQGGEQ